MNYIKYLLKGRGLYKVTFVNGESTFMKKTTWIDRSLGLKKQTGLLFVFPYEVVRGLTEMAPHFSSKEMVKAIAKMELALSYEDSYLDKALLEELEKKTKAYIEDTVRKGCYKLEGPKTKAFNKWFNSFEVQDDLRRWVDPMIGFADPTVERLEWQLKKAFDAGLNSREDF